MIYPCRTKFLLLLLAAVAMAMPGGAFAQFSSPGGGVDDSNGVFQLEGDAVTTGYICFGIGPAGPVIATPAGNSCPNVIDNKSNSVPTTLVQFGGQTQDWDKIFAGTSGVINTGIGPDAFNSASDTSFTGGSTKDTIDFSQWKWKTAKVGQPKDDFEHAYAAAYTRSDSHVIIVAGVDRYDNSGSSTAGFWFVQDPNVGSGVTGSCGGNGCLFGGTHKDGDVLIISQFTIGGAVSTIQVYTWDGTTNSLIGPAESGTQCDPRTGSTNLCGTVNGVPVFTGGWSFTPKSTISNPGFCTAAAGVTGTCMDFGEFLEIGLDLTALFQGLNKPLPCISTFFAESRASGTGTTSTLSDFVGPLSFPLCGIGDTKSCVSASINSDGKTATYNFNGTINNTGIGTLTGVSVSDNPNGGVFVAPGTACQSDGTGCGVITGSLVTNQPTLTTLAGKGSIGGCPNNTPCDNTTYSGSFVTNFASDSLSNTATASGVTPEGVTLTHNASWSNVATACHIAPSGCLALAKQCSTTLASGNPISVTVNLHNASIQNTANVVVSNITVTDSTGATITVSCGNQPASDCSGANGSLTLAPGKSATISGSYTTSTCTPSADGRCAFTDTITASGTGALGAGTISQCLAAQATCHLCPATSCSTGD
jgi:hypothetical protein